MAEKKKKGDISKLGFEEAIESLTDIVGNIESGQTPLQTSLEQYELGMALIKHCRSILQAAEKRIEKVARDDEKIEAETENTEESSDKELF